MDVPIDDQDPSPFEPAWLTDEENELVSRAHEIPSDGALQTAAERQQLQSAVVTLASNLARERQQQAHKLDVLRLNMNQQQAYYRLLGTVFVHHKDCTQCVDPMKMILEMIAHNVEHLDSLLPADERVKAPGEGE